MKTATQTNTEGETMKRTTEQIKVWTADGWKCGTTNWIDNDGTYLVTVDGVDSYECMGDIETL
jgi:hypothetical protein